MPRYVTLLLLTVFLISSAFSFRDARSYYQDGLQSLAQQNYVKAIGDFTSAISLSPTYADAYFQRANAKLMLSEQLGFAGNEQCSDWLLASKLGKPEAAQKLLQYCGNECGTATRIMEGETEGTFCLDWSNKQLEKLPEVLLAFPNLLRLDISNNALGRLDDASAWGTHLFQLDASRNRLAELPPAIGSLTYLSELNFSYNQLTSLPQSMGELRHLQVLYLRNNGLRRLPSELSRLQALEYLDLSFNELRSLPAELGKLTGLRKLILSGNPIPEAQQQHIRRLLPACAIQFD